MTTKRRNPTRSSQPRKRTNTSDFPQQDDSDHPRILTSPSPSSTDPPAPPVISTMLAEFEAALTKVKITDRDQAAVGLGRRLAVQIDEFPALLGSLAPKLLAVLRSLGMTPDTRKGQDDAGSAGDESERELAAVEGSVRPAG